MKISRKHAIQQTIQLKPALNSHVLASVHSLVLDESSSDAFFIGDMGSVLQQHENFIRQLPRIAPYYAVKCNPDPRVLETLNSVGTGFDCASQGEMAQVLKMGVSPTRIIYANPCKQVSHLKFAQKNGINMLTFDNTDELIKIKKHHSDAELVLRILADDSRSTCKLGLKFGMPLNGVSDLLIQARRLELNVIGISFHVGSGCFDASSYVDAVETAKKAFDIGSSLGFHFTFLDVGGGFPSCKSTGISFTQIASLLGPAVDQHFGNDVRVIAEPGRYYVSAAFTLCVSVTSRRTLPDEDIGAEVEDVESDSTMGLEDETPVHMYYVNDGMYGSFNCITFDHKKCIPQVICREGVLKGVQAGETLYNSNIWGPTCDSIDLLGKNIMLPLLEIGDWLMYEDMGAYTMSAASCFNGFEKTSIKYINSIDLEVTSQISNDLEATNQIALLAPSC